MIFEETELGFQLIENHFTVFFGKHQANANAIRKTYPHLDITTVHQTHSDQYIECTSPELDKHQADAHWSKLERTALLIKTADCIPIMAYNFNTKIIAAIHAGWRGVANQITQKIFTNLNPFNSPESWQVFIGPHILASSFEIQRDTFEILKASTTLSPEAWSIKSQTGWHVDLNSLVREQLRLSGINGSQIHWLNLDTKVDLRFHSHRRDKELAGRQLSFIARH